MVHPGFAERKASGLAFLVVKKRRRHENINMTSVRNAVLALIMIGFAGCVATTPALSPQEVGTIDYGSYPENFEQVIKDHFAKTLSDAAAAQYRFGKPFQGFLQSGPLLGGKVQDAGYVVEVWLKAKDRSGAYLPEKHLGVLLKNGEVLMELAEGELAGVRRPQ